MPRRLAIAVMCVSWIMAALVIWAFWGVPEHKAGPYVAIAVIIFFIGLGAPYFLGRGD
jgi:hypothetical protein